MDLSIDEIAHYFSWAARTERVSQKQRYEEAVSFLMPYIKQQMISQGAQARDEADNPASVKKVAKFVLEEVISLAATRQNQRAIRAALVDEILKSKENGTNPLYSLADFKHNPPQPRPILPPFPPVPPEQH
jgi:hypothetical protein